MKRLNFVHNERALEKELLSLKQKTCPNCGRRGTLNRHDWLYHNGVEACPTPAVKGKRVWCSNRGRRGGCGGTVTFLLEWILPRHSVTSDILWQVLELLLEMSVMMAVKEITSGVSLEGVYHILQRLRTRQDFVRTRLCSICPPPRSRHVNPLSQSVEHLRCAFPEADNPISAFQTHFQAPLMG